MAGLTPQSEPTRASSKDPISGLEAVLSSMIDAHEQMLVIAGNHRAAIARADGHGVQDCVEHTGVLAARVAELELQRRAIIAGLVKPGRGEKPTVSMVAAGFPEPARGRVLALASQLRDLLIRLRQEMRVIKSATQSLVAHMDGLMQQVVRALSQTRLYDPRGRIDPGGPAACGLDLTH